MVFLVFVIKKKKKLRYFQNEVRKFGPLKKKNRIA